MRPLRRIVLFVMLSVIAPFAGQAGGPYGNVVFDIDCAAIKIDKNSEIGSLINSLMKDKGCDDPDIPDRFLAYNPTAFTIDINNDGKPEYFVPFSCGSGGCWFFIIGDYPFRCIGEVGGKLVNLRMQKKGWAVIETLFMSGCGEAELSKYHYGKHSYALTSSNILHDYDACSKGEITNYRNQIGKSACGAIHKKA